MAFFHGNTIGQGVVIATPTDLGGSGFVLQTDGSGATVWAPPGGIDLGADYNWTGSHVHAKPFTISTDDGALGPSCLDVIAVNPSPLRALLQVTVDDGVGGQTAVFEVRPGATMAEAFIANSEVRSDIVNSNGADLSLRRNTIEKLALKAADAVFIDNVNAPSFNSVVLTNAGAGDLFLANDGTYKTPPSGGGGEANTGSNVGAGVGVFQTKVGVDLRFRSLVSDGSVGLAENADTISITATAAQIGALTAVEDDTSPKLGGDLAAPGTLGIIFRNQADDAIVASQGTLADDSGVYLGLTDDGTRQADWAALDINAGGINLYGSSVAIESLSNSVGELREVWADDNGVLFAAAPPDPGWSEFANDANNYDLGTGTGVGPWVKVVDCEITVPVDVPDGSRLDIWSNVDVVNKTTNRSGTISFGFGIDGNAPLSAGEPRAISPGFAGYIPTSLSTKTHGGLTTGQTIGLWARRESGSHNSFGVDLVGGIGDEHELIVSVPAEGGGGGSGDVLQGTGGTTGEVVVWQNFAAKTVHGTGLQVSAVSAHIASTSNPHGVTAAQVGALTQGEADTLYASLTAFNTHTGDATIHYIDAPADGVPRSRLDNDWTEAAITPIGGVALGYKFDTNTTATDPGSGNVKVNNADLTLATAIYASEITRFGNNADPAWASWRTGDYIAIQDEKNSNGSWYQLTGDPIDQTTWWEIPVAALAGGTSTIGNNRNVVVNIVESPLSRLPAGGNTGDVLAKVSATDYNTAWTPGVFGDGTITSVVKVTQAEYDALSPPDANTLYAIVG